MALLKIKILSWKDFHARTDVKQPSWFKFSHSFFEHPKICELIAEEKLIWIYLLCERSKRRDGEFVTVNTDLCHRVTGFSQEVIHRAAKKLKQLQMVEIRTLRGRYADVPPDKNKNREDKEQERDREEIRVPGGVAPPGRHGITIQTWDAYRDAYFHRYGSDPVRNATVNGQLSNFVKRIGSEEAPHVAAFFLGHNDQFYLKAMHPVSLMLRDAEKLRTEWATGRKITGTIARDSEKRDANAEVMRQYLQEQEDGKWKINGNSSPI